MNGYYYMATPYAKFPRGKDEAFRLATKEAARFMAAGVFVFAPIVHCHPMHVLAPEIGVELPGDWGFWGKFDRIMLERSEGLIVVTLSSWTESQGVTAEIKMANDLGRPIFYHEPGAPVNVP